jgi:hypothetical protein
MRSMGSESPLRWWRERPPGALGRSEIAAVKASIAHIAIPGEPRWSHARGGDPAAAVRLALTHDMRSHDADRTDLVMSALLVCAARGDGAARLVLLRQRIRIRRIRSGRE